MKIKNMVRNLGKLRNIAWVKERKKERVQDKRRMSIERKKKRKKDNSVNKGGGRKEGVKNDVNLAKNEYKNKNMMWI